MSKTLRTTTKVFLWRFPYASASIRDNLAYYYHGTPFNHLDSLGYSKDLSLYNRQEFSIFFFDDRATFPGRSADFLSFCISPYDDILIMLYDFGIL